MFAPAGMEKFNSPTFRSDPQSIYVSLLATKFDTKLLLLGLLVKAQASLIIALVEIGTKL